MPTNTTATSAASTAARHASMIRWTTLTRRIGLDRLPTFAAVVARASGAVTDCMPSLPPSAGPLRGVLGYLDQVGCVQLLAVVIVQARNSGPQGRYVDVRQLETLLLEPI